MFLNFIFVLSILFQILLIHDFSTVAIILNDIFRIEFWLSQVILLLIYQPLKSLLIVEGTLFFRIALWFDIDRFLLSSLSQLLVIDGVRFAAAWSQLYFSSRDYFPLGAQPPLFFSFVNKFYNAGVVLFVKFFLQFWCSGLIWRHNMI